MILSDEVRALVHIQVPLRTPLLPLFLILLTVSHKRILVELTPQTYLLLHLHLRLHRRFIFRLLIVLIVLLVLVVVEVVEISIVIEVALRRLADLPLLLLDLRQRGCPLGSACEYFIDELKQLRVLELPIQKIQVVLVLHVVQHIDAPHFGLTQDRIQTHFVVVQLTALNHQVLQD